MLSSPPAATAVTAAPEPPLRVLVGAILRRHRERQGRTLRDVAEAARVSLPYLSEVERGRKEASSEVLAAVCRALGLGLVDLVGDAHAHLAHTPPVHTQPARTQPARTQPTRTQPTQAQPVRASTTGTRPVDTAADRAGDELVDLTTDTSAALAPVVRLRREPGTGASVRLAA